MFYDVIKNILHLVNLFFFNIKTPLMQKLKCTPKVRHFWRCISKLVKRVFVLIKVFLLSLIYQFRFVNKIFASAEFVKPVFAYSDKVFAENIE